jgi:hypothetical protein
MLLLYSYFTITFLGVCMLCVPAYWPSRVCGGKWGAEERWSMGAWRVAAEGSWWSSATRTAPCLSTHPSRSCAGTYSEATAASTCVVCGAGEREACCSRVIWCPLTQSSLCTYGGGGCSTRIYVDSGKYRGLLECVVWCDGALACDMPLEPCHSYSFNIYIYMYICFNTLSLLLYIYIYIHTYMHTYMLYFYSTPDLRISIYLTVVILLYWNVYVHSCFTPTSLDVCVCVCVCLLLYVYIIYIYIYPMLYSFFNYNRYNVYWVCICMIYMYVYRHICNLFL